MTRRLKVHPESAIRRGLAMQQNGGLIHEIAGEIGLSRNTFTKARYLVLLLDEERPILSQDEAERIKAAVAAMNDTRTVVRPLASVADIIDRVYGGYAVRLKLTPYSARRRIDAAWDAYFGALTEVCSHAPATVIPAFTAEQAASVTAELKAATAQIDQLRRKIRRVSP